MKPILKCLALLIDDLTEARRRVTINIGGSTHHRLTRIRVIDRPLLFRPCSHSLLLQFHWLRGHLQSRRCSLPLPFHIPISRLHLFRTS